MQNFLIGCALAASVALSPTSEAKPPAQLFTRLSEASVPVGTVGIASWYGAELQGNVTASGEVFDMNRLTAAHRDLPLGTRIIVRNLQNSRSATLRVNDRGPNIPNRMVDVSRAAAKALGFLNSGLAIVQIEVLPAPTSGTWKPGNALRTIAF